MLFNGFVPFDVDCVYVQFVYNGNQLDEPVGSSDSPPFSMFSCFSHYSWQINSDVKRCSINQTSFTNSSIGYQSP